MIWFTADTHFNHRGAIKHYSRPFDTVDDMNDTMINNWNAVVNKDDTVYHLGDFVSSWPSGVDGPKLSVQGIVHRLNGNIRLVPGNHDEWLMGNVCNYHPRLTIMENIVYKMFSAFNNTSRTDNGRNMAMVLCHYPLEDWRYMSFGHIHLHGHTHGRSKQFGRRMDVGVDCNNWMPVPVTTIMKHMLFAPIVCGPFDYKYGDNETD